MKTGLVLPAKRVVGVLMAFEGTRHTGVVLNQGDLVAMWWATLVKQNATVAGCQMHGVGERP